SPFSTCWIFARWSAESCSGGGLGFCATGGGMVCSTAPEPGPAASAGTATAAARIPASRAHVRGYRMSGLLHEPALTIKTWGECARVQLVPARRVRWRSVPRRGLALSVGVRRVGGLDAAQEVERGMQRLVVLRVLRDVGLRAGLLGALALTLEVAAQLRLAGHVVPLLIGRHVLQHLDVGRHALRL